jgi:heat shock protein HslJ
MRKLILILPILLLSGCNSSKKTVSGTAVSPDGTWQLEYVSSAGNEFKTLYPNEKPTLTYDSKESRLSGTNGCNTYTGIVRFDNNNITFPEAGLVTTRMFCQGDGEKIYMKALRASNRYSVSNDERILTLMTGDIAVMRFHKN